MSSLRPRRSVLYMPAANERALEKAKTIAADAIIFDLEDAVAPDAKEAARENAVAAATSGDYGRRELTIRCNGLDTPWGAADIAAAAGSSAAAVVIPKVTSTDHLNEVDAQLRAAGAPDDMTIWAMVETPTAIFDIRSIAAHPRVNVLVMGTNDLIKELRAEQHADRAPLIPHLAMALLGAREHFAHPLAQPELLYSNIRGSMGRFARVRPSLLVPCDRVVRACRCPGAPPAPLLRIVDPQICMWGLIWLLAC